MTLVLIFFFLLVNPSESLVLATLPQALKETFGGGKVLKQKIYLKEDEKEKATQIAGLTVRSRFVIRYTNGKKYAYIRSDRVRSKRQTLLIVIDSKNIIDHVRVLIFHEPEEYLPSPKWLTQFSRKANVADLKIGEKVQGITGSSLTANSVSKLTRKVLAVHQIISKRNKQNK